MGLNGQHSKNTGCGTTNRQPNRPLQGDRSKVVAERVTSTDAAEQNCTTWNLGLYLTDAQMGLEKATQGKNMPMSPGCSYGETKNGPTQKKLPTRPQKPDIMGTVTVGSDRQKPTSHASALRNWGFLPGAAEVGFFRSYPDRTPHDSRGRNWGRSELNRESDTPKGTGQLPACELVGWLHISGCIFL